MRDEGVGGRVGFRWNPRTPFELSGYAHYSPVGKADLTLGVFEPDTSVGVGVMWYFFEDLGIGLDYVSGELDSVAFSMRFSFGDLSDAALGGGHAQTDQALNSRAPSNAATALLGLVLSATSHAAWEATPEVALGASHDDNLRLVPDDLPSGVAAPAEADATVLDARLRATSTTERSYLLLRTTGACRPLLGRGKRAR